MAVTYVSTPSEHGCRWSIYELGNYWDDNYYLAAAISTYGGWSNGSGSQPPNVLDTQYPPTSGTNYNTPSQEFYSGLNANTYYTLYGYAKAKNGLWYQAGSASITTLQEQLATPSVEAQEATYNSISLTLSAVSGAQTYYVDIYRTSDNVNFYNGVQSSRYFNFSGLSPNSGYYFYFKVSGSGYRNSNYGYYGICYTDSLPRPGTLNWTYTKTQGNDFYLHHSEWNSLIDTVQQWYAYKGYSSYTPTMYTRSAGQDFRAVDDYNRVKNAIGWFFNNSNPESGSGRANKASGDNVSAEDLNWLVYKINSIT